jgi:hypothetical protein
MWVNIFVGLVPDLYNAISKNEDLSLIFVTHLLDSGNVQQ